MAVAFLSETRHVFVIEADIHSPESDRVEETKAVGSCKVDGILEAIMKQLPLAQSLVLSCGNWQIGIELDKT